MCRGVAALRTLGLSRTATSEEVKTAFRALAKKWHPDRHQGASKVRAEEQFKEVQQAYQLLSGPGGVRAAMQDVAGNAGPRGASGAGSHTTHAGKRGAHAGKQQQWWGEHYGEASRPGYNPNAGYMGFGPGGKHWYEDTAKAARDEDTKRMYRSWAGAGFFFFGLYLCSYSAKRDSNAKARGELVDASETQ